MSTKKRNMRNNARALPDNALAGSAAAGTPANLPAETGKEAAEAKYLEVINALTRGRDKLRGIDAANEVFGALKEQLCSLLDGQAAAVKSEMRETIDGMPWDRLVLAFFGETTAGKSTLVETFRTLFERERPAGRDGLIVGDGRQDFTRERTEYDMEIDGRPFTLVDAPGIEGNEGEVLGAIKDSLKKIHCVFYVQGHNKKPDAATAEKVAGFLSDWVSVYSVQNVRGDAGSYDLDDDRETLMTANVRKNDTLIQNEFKRVLSAGTYKGNVPVQGLIALCARADFADECEKLKKAQRKLLGFFGNAEAMWEFSRAQDLVDLVRELAKPENFTKEINAANARKIRKLAQAGTRAADEFLKSQEGNLGAIRAALNDYKDEIDSQVDDATGTLRKGSSEIVGEIFSKLEDLIFGAIADGVEPGSVDAEIFEECLSESLRELCKGVLSACGKHIKERRGQVFKVLGKRIILETSAPALGSSAASFDFSGVGNAMTEGSLARGFGGGLAGGIVGQVLIPIPVVGAVIGGVVGGCLANLFGADERKTKARQEAAAAIGKARGTVSRAVNREMKKVCQELETWAAGLRSEADAELRNLDEMEAVIAEIKRNLQLSSAGA